MNTADKNKGFKTPEGYFDGLKDKIRDSLSDEASALPTDDGFSVPEDYFETLNDNIKAKINLEETKVVRLHPYKKYFALVASAAAVLVVYFGFNWNTPEELSFDDLVNSDIERYFETNDLGLSSYEIAEVLPLDELEVDDILENQLNEDNVIDYLNDNIDDFEDLNLDNDE